MGAGLVALLFLFVSCNAAFMGGATVSGQVDTTHRVIAGTIFVSLAVWAVALAFGLRRALFGRWLSDRRWKRIDRSLVAYGFREATPSEVAHTERLPAHILAPAILGPQRGGGIDHVRIRAVDGREVRCFNTRVRGGAWADVPVVAVRVEGSFPPTVVWSARFAVPPRPGMERMRFELEAFNRAFSVYSIDRFFASAVIDARMMEWLLSEGRGLTFELSDRWAIAWGSPALEPLGGPVDADRSAPRPRPAHPACDRVLVPEGGRRHPLGRQARRDPSSGGRPRSPGVGRRASSGGRPRRAGPPIAF
jgi:hypothetical protein